MVALLGELIERTTSALKTVFKDGRLVKQFSLAEIRENVRIG